MCTTRNFYRNSLAPILTDKFRILQARAASRMYLMSGSVSNHGFVQHWSSKASHRKRESNETTRLTNDHKLMHFETSDCAALARYMYIVWMEKEEKWRSSTYRRGCCRQNVHIGLEGIQKRKFSPSFFYSILIAHFDLPSILNASRRAPFIPLTWLTIWLWMDDGASIRARSAHKVAQAESATLGEIGEK